MNKIPVVEIDNAYKCWARNVAKMYKIPEIAIRCENWMRDRDTSYAELDTDYTAVELIRLMENSHSPVILRKEDLKQKIAYIKGATTTPGEGLTISHNIGDNPSILWFVEYQPYVAADSESNLEMVVCGKNPINPTVVFLENMTLGFSTHNIVRRLLYHMKTRIVENIGYDSKVAGELSYKIGDDICSNRRIRSCTELLHDILCPDSMPVCFSIYGKIFYAYTRDLAASLADDAHSRKSIKCTDCCGHMLFYPSELLHVMTLLGDRQLCEWPVVV